MKTSGRIAWIVCVASCISCLTVVTRAQVCVPEFAEQPGFAVGRNAGTSALVDLNEDGNLDLIVGLSFFLGDGTGLFDTHFRLPATPQVPEGFDVKAADFDLDGHLDLAMVMIGGPHMNFFYGRGYHEDPSELFDRPRSVDINSTVQGVWHIDTTDFNGDGLTDVVGISIVSSNVLVLLNRGDREFDRTKYVVKGGVGRGGNHMLTTGDFDGDGRSDVAVDRVSPSATL